MLCVAGVDASDRSYWETGKDSVQHSPFGVGLTADLFEQAQAGVVRLCQLISEA